MSNWLLPHRMLSLVCNLDEELSDRLSASEIPLRLPYAVRAERIFIVDLHLQLALRHEAEELGRVQPAFFGGVDVVAHAAQHIGRVFTACVYKGSLRWSKELEILLDELERRHRRNCAGRVTHGDQRPFPPEQFEVVLEAAYSDCIRFSLSGKGR